MPAVPGRLRPPALDDGPGLPYWGTLPLGILVSALLGGSGANSYRVV